LQRLEDRLELLELPARYSRAIDDRDIPTLVALFCDDGAFVHANGGRSILGKEAIEAFYRDILGGYGMSIHIPHAQVVDSIDGDEARGWVLSHAELAVGDDYVVVALRYEDQYTRVEGRWRFKERKLSFWYFAKWNELGTVVPSEDRMRFRGEPRPADLPESLPTFGEFVASRVL
jgi:ketosteroid isomerase-like protein